MDSIRQYVLQIVAAALICGILTSLPFNKGMLATAVKFVAGILMILSVVQPWVSISVEGLSDWKGEIAMDGEYFMSEGVKKADAAYRQSIKEQVEAYILDEADALDCALTVYVILSDDELPVPEKATITGEVSPYAKQTLSSMMEKQLGIQKEAQAWIN